MRTWSIEVSAAITTYLKLVSQLRDTASIREKQANRPSAAAADPPTSSS
jgi:hypothetical protein